MTITVNDILQLPPFSKSVLLAGRSGLSNIVKQVSIADTPPSEVDYVVAMRGDFYLSGFYFAKDSLESMYEFIEVLEKTGASGLCLIDEYISELPDEICDYCDRIPLPVLLVDKNIAYADMITSIMELIIFTQQRMIVENRLFSLISGNLDDMQKGKLLSELNPHFQNNLTAIYCIAGETESENLEAHKKDLINLINRNILMFAAEYKNGILILTSYKDYNPASVKEKLDYLLEKITSVLPDCTIGISSSNNLLNCGNAIKQAITAADSKRPDGSRLIYYGNLGIIRLLSLLNGHEEVDNFCKDIIDPILEHDKENNGQLFPTMVHFLENGKDYKKTARSFFLHENTIRYRISKIRELIAAESQEDDFYETISIALKIYKLNQAEHKI